MQSTLRLVCVLNCFLASYARAPFRVDGGTPALAGEFKYVVGIRSDFGKVKSLCTGGIIDKKFILTAAHCLANKGKLNPDRTHTYEYRKPKEVIVYANTTSMNGNFLGSSSALGRVVKRKVVKVYFKTDFLKSGIADIAILELESSLNLANGYLQKLKLPSADASHYSYKNVQAVVAGFGRDDTGVNDFTLKKAHFRILPYSRCEHYQFAFLYRQNSMCLISVTEDNKHPERPLGACHGDSGSPLVRGNTVIGIMKSVSERTCDGRDEDQQTCIKVAYYADFIFRVINKIGATESITEFEIKV